MLPQNAASNSNATSITDDELENCFSGMVSCHMSAIDNKTWIVDSGASDHMTFSLDSLCNVQPAPSDLIIKLPTGASTKITHIGNLIMKNGLILKKVLYAPQFQHNLLSFHRLSQDNSCVVNFHPEDAPLLMLLQGKQELLVHFRMAYIISKMNLLWFLSILSRSIQSQTMLCGTNAWAMHQSLNWGIYLSLKIMPYQ